MSTIEAITVEDMLSTKKMKILNGETVSGKQYLDSAITAFSLKSGDYYTALQILKWIAKGHDGEAIVDDIKGFWTWLETKYN